MKVDPQPSQRVALFILSALCFNYLAITLFNSDGTIVNCIRFGAISLVGATAIRTPYIQYFDLFFLINIIISFSIGGGENAIAANCFFMLAFCLFSRQYGLNNIVTTSFYTLLATTIIVFISLGIGTTQNSTEIIGNRARETLGFSNTNAFASLIYSSLLTLLLIEVRPTIKYTIVFSATLSVYLITNNRSLPVSIIFFFIIKLALKALNKKKIAEYLAIAFLTAPILATYLSKHVASEYPTIDLLLSMRPSLSARFLDELPWYSHLVGGFSPSKHITVDNSFLLIHAALGLPFLLLFTWKVFCKFMTYFESKELNKCALIISFWLFCFSESSLVRPETIISLIFWAMILQKTNDTA